VSCYHHVTALAGGLFRDWFTKLIWSQPILHSRIPGTPEAQAMIIFLWHAGVNIVHQEHFVSGKSS